MKSLYKVGYDSGENHYHLNIAARTAEEAITRARKLAEKNGESFLLTDVNCIANIDA